MRPGKASDRWQRNPGDKNPGVTRVAFINGRWTVVMPLVAALFIKLSWLLLICGLDVEGVVSYGVLAG